MISSETTAQYRRLRKLLIPLEIITFRTNFAFEVGKVRINQATATLTTKSFNHCQN